MGQPHRFQNYSSFVDSKIALQQNRNHHTFRVNRKVLKKLTIHWVFDVELTVFLAFGKGSDSNLLTGSVPIGLIRIHFLKKRHFYIELSLLFQ